MSNENHNKIVYYNNLQEVKFYSHNDNLLSNFNYEHFMFYFIYLLRKILESNIIQLILNLLNLLLVDLIYKNYPLKSVVSRCQKLKCFIFH